MKNEKLFKDLEKLVGRNLDSGKFDFFPGEVEVYDIDYFEEIICFLNINNLEKLSRKGFQKRLYSFGNISNDDKIYEITLKGDNLVKDFEEKYSKKYENKIHLVNGL